MRAKPSFLKGAGVIISNDMRLWKGNKKDIGRFVNRLEN
jgi:hypothetical protein